SIDSVQETVAEGVQRVVTESALAGGGITPPTHPAGGAQPLQTLLHAPLGGERIRERRTQLQKLPDGQRAPVEGLEDVAVPRGDKAEGGACHARWWSLHSRPSFHQISMAPEKKTFINVDELMPQLSLEDVARHYGVLLPELHRIGSETRARCFLTCGKTR